MFNIGIFEVFILIVVALIVVGPKDLPSLLRTVVGYVRKARKMSGEFQSSLKKIADDVEYEAITQEMNKAIDIDIDDPISQEAMKGIRPDIIEDDDEDLEAETPVKKTSVKKKVPKKKVPKKKAAPKKKTLKKTATKKGVQK